MSAPAFTREAVVFSKPGQIAQMCLPDGFRFVGLVSGSQPQAFPIDEPGMWEIDIPAMLAKGKYPRFDKACAALAKVKS